MSDIDSKINIDKINPSSGIRSLPTNNNKNSKLSKSRFGFTSNSGLASGSNFNFNFLFKLSKTLKVLLGLGFVLIALAGTYLINNQDFRTAFASGNDPVISIALSQKSGTAPFSGTCTPGGNTYTPGDDACDTDNVVRTLDTVEFNWTVSVTSDPANNVTVVQTLPSQMVWNRNASDQLVLPVFCRTGAGISPQSSYSGQTLTCNLGSFTAGTSTTTNYGQIFAKVKGDNPNGTSISAPAITANADSNIVAGTKIASVSSNTVSSLVVSATPKYDIFAGGDLEPNNPSTPAPGPLGEEGLLVNGLAVAVKINGTKGSELVQSPINFDVTFNILTPTASTAYDGARLYTWGDSSLPACTGNGTNIFLPGQNLGNFNCSQSAQGVPAQVTIPATVDLSGNQFVSTYGGTSFSNPNDRFVATQKIRFWIPKTDFDKMTGTNFQFNITASNFNPIGIANPNNTANPAGVPNNGLSTATSGTFSQSYNPAAAITTTSRIDQGDFSLRFITQNKNDFYQSLISVNKLFTTVNDLSVCANIDLQNQEFIGVPTLTTQTSVLNRVDISGAVIEYSNNPAYPATSCEDVDGPWFLDAQSAGGIASVTRIRISNIDNVVGTVGWRGLKFPFKTKSIVTGQPITAVRGLAKFPGLNGNNWIVNDTSSTIVPFTINTFRFVIGDVGNNNSTTALLNNPANTTNSVNTVSYQTNYTVSSGLTGLSTVVNIQDRLPVGQTYLVGSGNIAGTPIEPISIITNPNGTQDIFWSITNVNYGSSGFFRYKTIVSSFLPTGTILNTRAIISSTDLFNDKLITNLSPIYTLGYLEGSRDTQLNGCNLNGNGVQEVCSSSTITVQNLSSFAVEQVPNNPLIEKNKDLGFTLRYGNLDTLNPVASSTHINVFPFSSQTPPRSPATNFTGNLSFKGLVVAPNSNSSDPAVLNTNDNITGGAGTVQYTKAVSSSIASDPCDPSNNPSSSPVNTNPRCAGVDASVIGTGTTIWCTAALNPSTPTIKQYTVLGTTGTVGANSSTCPTTLSEVTGVRFTTGTLPVVSGTTGAVIYEIGLNFSTSGNTNNNIYTNLSQARAAGIATVATSNSAVTRVTTGSISGNIFNDKDSNGIKDVLTPIPNPAFNSALPADPVTNPATIPNPANDFNLSNVTVELRHGTGNLDSSGAVIAANTLIETKTTDSTGNYTFTNVSSGNYTVVVLQNGIPLSRQTTDKDFAANLAANPTTPNLSLLDNKTAVTLNFVAGTGVTSSSDVNFGYNQYSRITGKIYADTNNNGTQDGSEPDFNATTNPIPTGTSVVITSTSNPSITYTLTTATSSTVVSGFTTGSISTATTPSGSFGTFSQDLPVGEYTVTVATTNPKYAVSTSTQLGDSLGANPSTLTLSFGETKSSGSDGLYLVQIQNSDIQSIVCTPTSTNVNTTVNCVVTLAGSKNFSGLTGSIKLKISDGVETSCPAFPASGTSITCTGVNVGTLIGTYKPNFNASGSTTTNAGTTTAVFSSNGSSDVVVINPIQNSDIQSLNCTPTPTNINSSVNCLITLASGRNLNNFTGSVDVRVRDINSGGTGVNGSGAITNCVIPTATTLLPAITVLNCNNVNVGPTPGTFPSQFKASGTATTFVNGNNIVVTNAIANSDIDSVVCSPTTTSVNTTVNCIVTLISGKTFNTLTGDIKLQISNGAIATCPNFTTSISPFNTLTCTAIPVGTLIGTFKARYSAANEKAIDTKSNSITVINDLVRNDLASIAVTCIPAVVNFITTCTFTLPTNKTLPVSPNDLKLGIGNGATSGSCRVSTVDNRTVTCINVPTGSVGGTQPIRGQIGNGIPGDLSGNSAITDLSGVVEIGFVTSDVLFIPDSAITLTPNPVTTGLSIFGATDYTIVVKDDRMVTTPGSSLNSSAAVCTYRVKELSSQPNDANRGYTKLTSTIISPYNNGGTYNANSTVTNLPTNTNTNTTPTPTPQYEVNYNTGTGTTTGTTNNNTTGGTTNLGTSIKITKENQKFVDYNLEIRCKRTSDGQLFGRDERINFLFGAYSIVTVTGVVVV